MTKLTVAFHNFVNAPKNVESKSGQQVFEYSPSRVHQPAWYELWLSKNYKGGSSQNTNTEFILTS
jgi:hypothetical protein